MNEPPTDFGVDADGVEEKTHYKDEEEERVCP
jgi:hypothetical protein